MPLPLDFDPDAPGGHEGLYGLPIPPEEARVQVIPVPWEATTSYGRGAAAGPSAILAASQQVDLFDLDYGDFWRVGVALRPEDPRIRQWAEQAEPDALLNIESGGQRPDAAARVSALGEQVNELVYQQAREILAAGAIPGVLGGDHSAPYGLIRAVAEAFPGVGILHIDAHADLRVAYMGFRWSHASIFHNVLELPEVGKLVGVGYRDVGQREVERIRRESSTEKHQHERRIEAFWDREIARELADGTTWLRVARRIVEALPQDVHVSFDIDGLDPTLCPGTGTPVPGGLSFHQVQLLLSTLASHRRVVGFDLCEVAPGGMSEWDANVGARLLYKLAGCAVRSQDPGWIPPV